MLSTYCYDASLNPGPSSWSPFGLHAFDVDNLSWTHIRVLSEGLIVLLRLHANSTQYAHSFEEYCRKQMVFPSSHHHQYRLHRYFPSSGCETMRYVLRLICS